MKSRLKFKGITLRINLLKRLKLLSRISIWLVRRIYGGIKKTINVIKSNVKHNAFSSRSKNAIKSIKNITA